ncbi:substrate-binding periplasmic protein [Aestuariispira insulae]|nr:transporter substrate-binding domain-containing protein [Aestuariispira insulae]
MAFPFVSPVAGEPLLLVTEEYPPMNYRGPDGVVTGRATELLRVVAAKAGIEYEIRVLPWKRAYHMALHDKGVCVYSTWRTEEREKLFQWIGPLALDAWSFFARKEQRLEIGSLTDTFQYNVGAVEGWGVTQYLVEQGHPSLDKVAKDDTTNLRKLLLGRIDLWVTGRIIAEELLAKQQIRSVEEVYFLREVELSVACNIHNDPDKMKRLQFTLDLVRQEQAGEASPN